VSEECRNRDYECRRGADARTREIDTPFHFQGNRRAHYLSLSPSLSLVPIQEHSLFEKEQATTGPHQHIRNAHVQTAEAAADADWTTRGTGSFPDTKDLFQDIFTATGARPGLNHIAGTFSHDRDKRSKVREIEQEKKKLSESRHRPAADVHAGGQCGYHADARNREEVNRIPSRDR
jgi:hypothetical protein